ncbi:MAG: hypothetical protein ACYTGN_07375 [Planctomycetota bacterium]
MPRTQSKWSFHAEAMLLVQEQGRLREEPIKVWIKRLPVACHVRGQ